MFHVAWTRIAPKPPAEAEELFASLTESIAIDGPTDFAVLVYATQLLETEYVLARVTGFPDRELVLDYTDVVELFESLDAALAALARSESGLIELYPGVGADFLLFECDSDEVSLFRVPWRETPGFEAGEPLAPVVRTRPMATRDRIGLIDHLTGLRRSFAEIAIQHDPRLVGLDPIRRWLPSSRSGIERREPPATGSVGDAGRLPAAGFHKTRRV